MGLGPPVCLDCMRMLDYRDNVGKYEDHYWCGKDGDHERTTHLWCVLPEVAKQIEANSRAERETE